MSSRLVTSFALVGVAAAGLLARDVLPAGVGGPLGDALYATLVVLAVVMLRPRTSPVVAALVGFAVCVVLELFQATGVPAALAEHWPPVRLVLGTTFWAPDLLRYAAGAVLGGLLCAVLARAGRGRTP
ncbi:DUF2809 domain-containing protein [Mumia sp. DW29H23]|uniref:ribosomal maturation YjgA family protein n=1 Tax=Mumia sp. DW29H23 TaxID=3421241 RepID=UPI003D68FE7F